MNWDVISLAAKTNGIKSELAKLDKRMHELMSARKWRQALKVYAEVQILHKTPDLNSVFYNNCALCHEALGEPDKALQVLAPNLRPEAYPSPFAHALAARILHGLRLDLEARAQFKEAVADFEAGLKAYGREPAPEAWCEYLLILQSVAGDLGNHRQVMEFHQRWEPLYLTDHNYFLAGVAAFNLKRYKQAAAYWRPRFRDEWSDFLSAYHIFAEETERGLLPPLVLPYHPPDGDKLTKKTRKVYDPAELVQVFADLIAKGYKEYTVLKELCMRTGDWGAELARNLTKDAGIPERMQTAAFMALVEMGRHPAGEPYTILVDGRPQEITYKKMEVVCDDKEAACVVAQAVKLRDAGKIATAEKILRELLEKVLYPPALLTLANLLRRQKKLEEASTLLGILADIAPDNPRVLFNLCGLYLQMDEHDKALACYNKIDPEGEDEGFLEHYKKLGETFKQSDPFSFLLDPHASSRILREVQDDKLIDPGLPLMQALRRVPADWLTAACAAYGLSPAGLKEERIKQLNGHITADPRRALARLPKQARDCLRFILDAGGCAKVSEVEKQHGSMSEDGFWWKREPPSSNIGLLRLRGLAFIGRMTLEKRRQKVILVPEDIRGALVEALSAPGRRPGR